MKFTLVQQYLQAAVVILAVKLVVTQDAYAEAWSIQLANGGRTSNAYFGRVEVFLDGVWGTVCGYSWNLTEASVVCRQLGFPFAKPVSAGYYGPGSGRIWLTNVSCSEEEELRECSYNQVQGPLQNCSHHDDIGVMCYMDDIRLVRGHTSELSANGTVQVYREGRWTDVCGDSAWDVAGARVVCARLGFNQARVVTWSTARMYSRWMHGVTCVGNESSLLDCSHQGISYTSCTPAGVECQNYYHVRLVNGIHNSTVHSGRVEVVINGEWGTVCDDGWDTTDASVVCRQLGYPVVLAVYSSAHFGPGTGTIWFDDLQCSGEEEGLDDCSHIGIGRHNCGHSEDAGVACSSDTVRLVNGPNDYTGRVEVFVNGQWGTVCDDIWDINDAHVICRQLGYLGARTRYCCAQYGQGTGPMLHLGCQGSEASFHECSQSVTLSGCSHLEDAGVECYNDTATRIPIRLVGGAKSTSFHSGRVELYINGQWGTVCDNSWSSSDARVVCRQLGYARGMAYGGAIYGEGTGPIWLDYVRCRGYESSLLNCGHRGTGRHNCGHGEDASVVCYNEHTGALRLGGLTTSGSYSGHAGRVEVYYSGSWGTVCDDGWDINDASVACRQLGFAYALAANCCAAFGQGSGSILLDDLTCTGSESSIVSCPHGGVGTHNCGHGEDAGVVCSHDKLRLVGGVETSSTLSGRVEVFINGEWGTVCDDGWDINDANVACRQLGFGYALTTSCCAAYGQGSGSILLDELTCTGSESSLASCPHGGVGIHNCGHSEDAGVVCSNGTSEVRLVGGVETSSTFSGRVEVFINGEWGTVCDDWWDSNDASVVCHQLGFEYALEAKCCAAYGQGSGSILLDDLTCTGSESSLASCPHRGIGAHNCGHREDAGVVCAHALVRLVGSGNYTNSLAGRVEVWNNGGWGTVCDDFWDLSDAAVVCHQFGYEHTLSAPHRAAFGQGSGPIWLDNVACVGNESSILNCTHLGISVHNCGHSEDASAVCYKDGKVRLMNNTGSAASGQVEISVNGEWGTVCDNAWNLDDATVVCRQLGYDGAGTAHYQPGSGLVKVEDPQCSGEEVTLLDCWTAQSNGGGMFCSHGRDVAVECVTSPSELEVVHITTNSVILHVLVSDHVNTTFRIEVDGQQWAHTVKSAYTVSGLARDREYTFSVTVVRSGMFVSTMSQTVRTLQLSPPVISAQAIGPYSINVVWNTTEEEEARAIHYEIQWSTVAVDKADDINSTSMTIHRKGNASSVLIRELLPATEYSFQVRVVATDGWGQWSHQVTAKTDPAVPGQVTDLLVNDTSTVSLTVMWNPPMLHSGVITMYKVSLSTGGSISQEVLLAGTVLKHTFHGLSPGTGYTISVTAATDAGLGREDAITATTVAMPQSLEAAVSVPIAGSVFGVLTIAVLVLALCLCVSCIGSRHCHKKKAATSGTPETVTMREVEKHTEEAIASEMPEPIYEIFDPEGNELVPSPAMMPSSMASAVSSNTWKGGRMPHNEKAHRVNQYDYPPKPIPLEGRYSAGPSSSAHAKDTQVQYMNTQVLHKM